MSDATFWRGGNETNDCGVTSLNADLDRIFTLLSHPRRRALLYLLSETEQDPAWTTNLAVELAGIEASNDEDPHDVAEDIVLTLRHNHLPKLADVGLIDTDAEMATLTYEGDERLEELLQWSQPKEETRTELHPE